MDMEDLLSDAEVAAMLAAGAYTPLSDLGSTPVRPEVIKELRARVAAYVPPKGGLRGVFAGQG